MNQAPLLSFRRPGVNTIQAFLAQQERLPFSYPEVGASFGTLPEGYAVNRHRQRLGTGDAAFAAAREALARWEMFHVGWAFLAWPQTPVKVGAAVGVAASRLGVWSLNACRIVGVLDEADDVERFGFAYGTLPGHLVRGEERFGVERHRADGSVWYDLVSFSRPNHLLSRWGGWYVQWLQRRFARDSAAAILRAVEAGVKRRQPCRA